MRFVKIDFFFYRIELVNKCALDYFFVELSLDEHFTAFWNYLLMGDGDFAQNLTDLLFEKVSLLL